MNLSDMRTLARRDLHDEDSANYRWTNDELDRCIARAVKQFSQAISREMKDTLQTTIGSRDIDISSLTDRVRIDALEHPIDQYPRSFQRFSLWKDTLSMLITDEPAAVEDVHIYWGKIHTLDASTSTIPTKHEDLIILGATAYAMVQWAVYSVNRVSVGGDRTPSEFQKEGERRLNYFKAELKRLGRTNRVRAHQLYKPASEPSSQSTVFGP